MNTGTIRLAGMGRAAASPAASDERRMLRLPVAALALCACVMACTPGFAPAAEPVGATERGSVVLGVGSELTIEGTSTLHPWSSRTDSLRLVFRLAPGTARPADARGLEALVRAQGVRGLVVDVPVRSLRSAKEPRLDKNLWKTMRADEFPTVQFELSSYALDPTRAGSDTLAVHAQGTLAIRGRVQRVELDARVHAGVGGSWLVGSKELLMSDYGIRPPTMMMGTLRVGNRIQVHYRLLLVPGARESSATTAGSDEKGAK